MERRRRRRAQATLNVMVDEYRDRYPSLTEWFENSVPNGLGIFAMPDQYRLSMRTSDPMDHAIKQEIKRRARVIRVAKRAVSDQVRFKRAVADRRKVGLGKNLNQPEEPRRLILRTFLLLNSSGYIIVLYLLFAANIHSVKAIFKSVFNDVGHIHYEY